MSQVANNLYIGGIIEATDKKWLQNRNITHIVNATKEIPNFFPSSIRYLNLYLIDMPEQNLTHVLEKSYRFIKDAVDKGGNVLVHCFAGISRSSSIVVYYLMNEYNWSYRTAMTHLKRMHPRANPNAGFVFQLNKYHVWPGHT